MVFEQHQTEEKSSWTKSVRADRTDGVKRKCRVSLCFRLITVGLCDINMKEDLSNKLSSSRSVGGGTYSLHSYREE